MTKNLYFLIVLIFFLAVIPQNAKAYLDPGTASFMTQIIIACLVTAVLLPRIIWQKIKNIFLILVNCFNKKWGKNG